MVDFDNFDPEALFSSDLPIQSKNPHEAVDEMANMDVFQLVRNYSGRELQVIGHLISPEAALRVEDPQDLLYIGNKVAVFAEEALVDLQHARFEVENGREVTFKELVGDRQIKPLTKVEFEQFRKVHEVALRVLDVKTAEKEEDDERPKNVQSRAHLRENLQDRSEIKNITGERGRIDEQILAQFGVRLSKMQDFRNQEYRKEVREREQEKREAVMKDREEKRSETHKAQGREGVDERAKSDLNAKEKIQESESAAEKELRFDHSRTPQQEEPD